MVAGSNNAVFRKQQHGARTLDMLIYIFDALHKVSALYQEQGYKFCLIGFAGAQFGEVHILFQKLGFQFLQIHNLGNRYNGKTTEVGI